ncbi:hypothetical protein EDC19_0440 [Natranaerovirga hydrolytica]|uniref:pEK499-p136 HEPN domain-containing protein n=1 Tax=Natranaerovirga hydrolytica TaxID=680378 RepID=A0A4R1N501_9FIRM|nr:HEPN family nuclease [Natranaerovirga hydrolytica]TCK98029.1 hypothetical protein EDC19_0440 [Natranaerovirga hydrolytica]
MKKENVTSMIAVVRMANNLLGLIDQHKNNKDIKLSEILEKINKDEHHYFWNQYQMLTSLTAFIVIPKETFWNDVSDIELSKLSERWGLRNVSSKYADMKLKFFLRKIRNSISHGNIEIDKTVFIFKDKNPDTSKYDFIVNLTYDELSKFVQAFARYIMTSDIELQNL